MFKLVASTVTTVVVIAGIVAWAVSTHGSSISVFDGVTDAQLAQVGISIIDPQPTGRPSIAEYDTRRSVLKQAGVIVEGAQLVLIDLMKPGPPGAHGEHLAWAVRIDPSGVVNQEYYGPPGFAVVNGPEFVIAFFSASTGQYLAKYESHPS